MVTVTLISRVIHLIRSSQRTATLAKLHFGAADAHQTGSDLYSLALSCLAYRLVNQIVKLIGQLRRKLPGNLPTVLRHFRADFPQDPDQPLPVH